MRQQTQALVIRKPMDESPQRFGLLRQSLAPCGMTLGDLLLANALVDAGRVSRKPRALGYDFQARTFAARKERRQGQRMGDARGFGWPVCLGGEASFC
jgi:hypothetical protein